MIVVGPITIFFFVLFLSIPFYLLARTIYMFGCARGEENIVLDRSIKELPIGVQLCVVRILNEELVVVRRKTRLCYMQSFWVVASSELPPVYVVFKLLKEGDHISVCRVDSTPESLVLGGIPEEST
jgi:hypothetical protein